MHALAILAIVVVIFLAGAVVTFIGARLIERAHPPRGRFIDIGGLRQHVVELGPNSGAPPLVLLHGAGCNLEDMRLALGEALAARHRVILIDRAGLGWSERKGRRGSSPAYQAALLRGVLDALSVERAIVVGHSWGGALAACFALDYPERAAALVLLAPPLYRLARHMTWLYTALATPFAGWLLARTFALPFGVLGIGPGIASAFLPQWPPWRYLKRSAALLVLRPRPFLANARDVADLKTNLASQIARYAALAAPAVVITGDCDMVVPPRQHALAFAAAVPAAKLVVLPGIGHMLHHVAKERVIMEIEKLIANSE